MNQNWCKRRYRFGK